MRRTRRRSRHPRQRKNRPAGGAAIASGGFGCVFSPALTCEDGPALTARQRAETISKLMTTADAEGEIHEVEDVMPILSSIPNASTYFLGVDQSSPPRACKPNRLTSTDKMGFSTCSTAFSRAGITSSNVNSKRDELRIINSPYGGVELEKAWTRASTAGLGVYSLGFKALNNACRRLLKYGIVPMNKKNLLHGDIKASNILVDVNDASRHAMVSRASLVNRLLANITPAQAASGSDGTRPYVDARLIDWGLSMRARNGRWGGSRGVPAGLYHGKYLMYNAPISMILFSQHLQGHITHYYEELGLDSPLSPIGKQGLMWNLALRIYAVYRSIVGDHGHDKYLTDLIANVYAPLLVGPDAAEKGLRSSHGRMATFQITVVEYIAEVFMHYIDDSGRFMAEQYFSRVFKWNMDVYGLVTCYAPIIESGQYDDLFEWQRPLSNGVVRILAEYCFSPKYAATPIPVDKLLEDLGKLNEDPPADVHGSPGRSPAPASPQARQSRQDRQSQQAYRKGSARRCRNGFKYRRSDGMCVPRARGSAPTRRRRCPNGTRRGRDGECHPK